ncbi:MAG: type II toxin-antitoxin system mRNA interferase toxin, RelE/StbE family [Candidatus Uhrbacteria bacterium]
MEISYSPNFLREFHSLPSLLQEEVTEKLELFTSVTNHQALKVHKLSGRLRECHALSVNYQIRILFQFVGKPKRAYLLSVGDHDIYNR